MVSNAEAFPFCCRVHFCDDPDAFVSESYWGSVCSVLVHKIGVAERSRRNLDQDLAEAWFGDGYFIDNNFLGSLRN